MRILVLAALMAASQTSLQAQRTSGPADTTNDGIARTLAAVPLEQYLADSNLHVINLYKVEATILRESLGRSRGAAEQALEAAGARRILNDDAFTSAPQRQGDPVGCPQE